MVTEFILDLGNNLTKTMDITVLVLPGLKWYL